MSTKNQTSQGDEGSYSEAFNQLLLSSNDIKRMLRKDADFIMQSESLLESLKKSSADGLKGAEVLMQLADQSHDQERREHVQFVYDEWVGISIAVKAMAASLKLDFIKYSLDDCINELIRAYLRNFFLRESLPLLDHSFLISSILDYTPVNQPNYSLLRWSLPIKDKIDILDCQKLDWKTLYKIHKWIKLEQKAIGAIIANKAR